MDGMSRRERMAAAMAGRPVDRPPVAVWLHFASEHLTGEESAELHLRYMRRYDWDLCKVMNDYRYPLPAGVTVLASVDEMRRFEPASLAEPAYAEQLKCLRRLRQVLGPDVPLFETLFDPVQQVLRRVGQSRAPFLYAHPEPALAMLDAVTRTLEAYVAASARRRRAASTRPCSPPSWRRSTAACSRPPGACRASSTSTAPTSISPGSRIIRARR